MGCNIVVDEVQNNLVSRSVAIAMAPTASSAAEYHPPGYPTAQDSVIGSASVAVVDGAEPEPEADAAEAEMETKVPTESSSQGEPDEPKQENKEASASSAELVQVPFLPQNATEMGADASEGEAAAFGLGGDGEADSARRESGKKGKESRDASEKNC